MFLPVLRTKGYYIRKLLFSFNLVNRNFHKFRHRFHSCVSLYESNPAVAPGYAKEEDVDIEPFDNHVEKRRQQAQRSIVVQVHSDQSCAQLYEYCSQFGNITSMHHYTASNSTMHFILMEFSNKEVISEVLNACGHTDRNQIIPIYSRMVWFRANQKKKTRSTPSTLSIPLTMSPPPLVRSQLLEWLRQAENISDQIMVLYRATRLDDLGVRLRYVTAYQLETAVSGLFPRARVLQFGSSVNGFGRQGCDLDLVLQLDHHSEEQDENCRLMFHAKPSTNARSQIQRHIDGLADLVQWFLPGCSEVRRILLARVPIVKYRQEFTDIECDLSLTNMTAVYMSEMLYTYGNIDWRLRPLVFTVKRWAAEVGLTNPSPGRWITNFSLTLLVIFYFQKKKLLPSLDTLRQKASKSDRRISEDGVNCTFLRDVSKLSHLNINNTTSLESLLVGFFDYYASFDFATQGIALGSGAPIKKRDHAALYITNPLETHLNVSQNVSLEETERLKMEFRNAAWELESSSTNADVSNHSSDWGMLRLYKEDELIDKAKQLEHLYTVHKKRNTNNRLVPMSKLFEEDTEQTKSKNKTKLKEDVVR